MQEIKAALKSSIYSGNDHHGSDMAIKRVEPPRSTGVLLKKTMTLNLELPNSGLYDNDGPFNTNRDQPCSSHQATGMLTGRNAKCKHGKPVKLSKCCQPLSRPFVGLQQKLDQIRIRQSGSCMMSPTKSDDRSLKGFTNFVIELELGKDDCDLQENQVSLRDASHKVGSGVSNSKVAKHKKDTSTKESAKQQDIISNSSLRKMALNIQPRLQNTDLPVLPAGSGADSSKFSNSNSTGLYRVSPNDADTFRDSSRKISPKKAAKKKKTLKPLSTAFKENGKKEGLSFPSPKATPRDVIKRSTVGIADVLNQSPLKPKELARVSLKLNPLTNIDTSGNMNADEYTDTARSLKRMSPKMTKNDQFSPRRITGSKISKPIFKPATQAIGISQVMEAAKKDQRKNLTFSNLNHFSLAPIPAVGTSMGSLARVDSLNSEIMVPKLVEEEEYAKPISLADGLKELAKSKQHFGIQHQSRNLRPDIKKSPISCKRAASKRDSKSGGHFLDELRITNISKHADDDIGSYLFESGRMRAESDIDEVFLSLLEGSRDGVFDEDNNDISQVPKRDTSLSSDLSSRKDIPRDHL